MNVTRAIPMRVAFCMLSLAALSLAGCAKDRLARVCIANAASRSVEVQVGPGGAAPSGSWRDHDDRNVFIRSELAVGASLNVEAIAGFPDDDFVAGRLVGNESVAWAHRRIRTVSPAVTPMRTWMLVFVDRNGALEIEAWPVARFDQWQRTRRDAVLANSAK